MFGDADRLVKKLARLFKAALFLQLQGLLIIFARLLLTLLIALENGLFLDLVIDRSDIVFGFLDQELEVIDVIGLPLVFPQDRGLPFIYSLRMNIASGPQGQDEDD